MPKPHFGLEQIEGIAGARGALSEIIEATKGRHGPEISSKQHSLLEDLGLEVYAEDIDDCAFSGHWRLSPSHVDLALRGVFEIALQTLVQLPARDPKVPRVKDKLVSLASQFSKLAMKVDPVVRSDKRIYVYLGGMAEDEKLRLFRLSAQLRWAAEKLNAIFFRSAILQVPQGQP